MATKFKTKVGTFPNRSGIEQIPAGSTSIPQSYLNSIGRNIDSVRVNSQHAVGTLASPAGIQFEELAKEAPYSCPWKVSLVYTNGLNAVVTIQEGRIHGRIDNTIGAYKAVNSIGVNSVIGLKSTGVTNPEPDPPEEPEPDPNDPPSDPSNNESGGGSTNYVNDKMRETLRRYDQKNSNTTTAGKTGTTTTKGNEYKSSWVQGGNGTLNIHKDKNGATYYTRTPYKSNWVEGSNQGSGSSGSITGFNKSGNAGSITGFNKSGNAANITGNTGSTYHTKQKLNNPKLKQGF